MHARHPPTYWTRVSLNSAGESPIQPENLQFSKPIKHSEKEFSIQHTVLSNEVEGFELHVDG
jgi:hypothetical protein